MKPVYNSKTGRRCRPRKANRPIGVMPRGLKEEAAKYGITSLSVGMTLISLGVEVINLNIK